MTSSDRAARTDAGLAAELRLAVMRLRRRLAAEHHPDNALSLTAMAVLAGLLRDGDLTVGQLASRERVRPPSMTRTVHCLEDAGLVARRASPSDGRQVLVALTDSGRETVLADRQRRDAWLARRLRALSAEQRAVLAAAAPVLAALAEED